jgi:hypothetical protein
MTHPAQGWIDAAAKKRKRGGGVEGCARGGRPDRPGKAKGGRLDAEERQDLPSSDFALPGHGNGPKGAGAGSYPIPDESHGRNALARVSQRGSPEEKARVRAAVHRKFPGIKEG